MEAKGMPGVSDSVEDQANLVVCEFTLREDLQKADAAKKCRCRTCVSRYEDALDRRDWALGIGKWFDKKVGEVTRKGKRVFVYKSGRMQDE